MKRASGAGRNGATERSDPLCLHARTILRGAQGRSQLDDFEWTQQIAQIVFITVVMRPEVIVHLVEIRTPVEPSRAVAATDAGDNPMRSCALALFVTGAPCDSAWRFNLRALRVVRRRRPVLVEQPKLVLKFDGMPTRRVRLQSPSNPFAFMTVCA